MTTAWHTIDALRVDSDYSADPQDYLDRATDEPVGRELHGFLTAHVDGLRWPSKVATLLTMNPTRTDLERWSKVRRLEAHCGRLQSAGSTIDLDQLMVEHGCPRFDLDVLMRQHRR